MKNSNFLSVLKKSNLLNNSIFFSFLKNLSIEKIHKQINTKPLQFGGIFADFLKNDGRFIEMV